MGGRRDDGLTTEARSEMGRLKREVKRLRMERDILRNVLRYLAGQLRNLGVDVPLEAAT